MSLIEFINQNPTIESSINEFVTNPKQVAMLRPFCGYNSFVIQKKNANYAYRIYLLFCSKKTVKIEYVERYLLNPDETISVETLQVFSSYHHLAPEFRQDIVNVFSSRFVQDMEHGITEFTYTEIFELMPEILGFEGNDKFFNMLNCFGFLTGTGINGTFRSIFDILGEEPVSSQRIQILRCKMLLVQAVAFERDGIDVLNYAKIISELKSRLKPALNAQFQDAEVSFNTVFGGNNPIIKIRLSIARIGVYVLEFDPFEINTIRLQSQSDRLLHLAGVPYMEQVAVAIEDAGYTVKQACFV